MSISLIILALLTIPIVAVILAILLPGNKNLFRAQGLYGKTNEKLIYPLGPLIGVIIILPSLLFNQYLDTNSSFSILNSQFSIFLACYLLVLLVSIKKDLHKTYPIQWLLLWLIIAILLSDLGHIHLLNRLQCPIKNAPLNYWFSLLLLFTALLFLYIANASLPKTPKTRSWILLPSLFGVLVYQFYHERYTGILLVAALIGIFLFAWWLNRKQATDAWDPGSTGNTLTLFSLFWITMEQPASSMLWFALIWLIPLLLIIMINRFQNKIQ